MSAILAKINYGKRVRKVVKKLKKIILASIENIFGVLASKLPPESTKIYIRATETLATAA